MKQNFILLILSLLLFSCESVRTGGDNLPCSQIKDIGIFENERDLPLEGQHSLKFVNLSGDIKGVLTNSSFFNTDATEQFLSVHSSDCATTNEVIQTVWQQENHQLSYTISSFTKVRITEKLVVDSLSHQKEILGEYYEVGSRTAQPSGFVGREISVMAFPINNSVFEDDSKFNFGYDLFENIIINGRTFPKLFASKNFLFSSEASRLFFTPSGELVAFETLNNDAFIHER